MTATIYQITWRNTPADDDYSEAATEGTLDEIREWCREGGVVAVLSDAAGFNRGRVDADGSYSLT